MTPKDQAVAIRLLRRWRALCLDAGGPPSDVPDLADVAGADVVREKKIQLADDLEALTILFVETDQFLNPGAPSVGGAH